MTVYALSVFVTLIFGALLQRRYVSFVLVPASFLVLVLFAAVNLCFNAGFWTSTLTLAIGLMGLQLGYLVGLMSPFFLRRPHTFSSFRSDSNLCSLEGARCRETTRLSVGDEMPHRVQCLRPPHDVNAQQTLERRRFENW